MTLESMKEFAKTFAHEYKASYDRIRAERDNQQQNRMNQADQDKSALNQNLEQPAAHGPPPPLPPRDKQAVARQQLHVDQARPPPSSMTSLPQGQMQHQDQLAQPQQQAEASPPDTSREPARGCGSPNCSGFNEPMGDECCISPAIPDFATCAACYKAHIASSCYNNRMSLVSNTDKTIFCSFSIRAIRDIWTQTCLRANLPSATAEDQKGQLEYYKQQHAHIFATLRGISDQRDKIAKELAILRERYKVENDAAWQQAIFSAQMGAASSLLDSNRVVSTVGHDMANDRGLNAKRIAAEIGEKGRMDIDLLGQMKDLVNDVN